MRSLLLCLLAGLASACGFEPLGAWPVTLAGLAVLLGLVARAPSLRSALARGWWFGVGHFVLGLNWIATSFTYQANMPAWLGWVAVVLLSLYLAVYPAIAAGLAWRHGRGDPPKFVLIFAAAWTVSEWLRATLFTGFAWNPIGVALLPTPVSRLAAWVGTYGLSAVAVLIAGALALLVARDRRAALLLLAAIGGATMLTFATGRPPRATPLALRIVQPNIGQEDKWQSGSAERHLQRLALLSGYPGDRPRLLLWPEAAVTLPLQDGRADPVYRAQALQLQRALAKLLGPRDLLLTGGITLRSADGVNATSATNSIFAIGREGIVARYDKAHLVPYGEYLPMRPILSAIGLSRLAPGDVDFDAGPGPQTLDLPFVGKAGFQLCYEIIFSGEVVERGKRPAFLFNPSNDAWFGGWGPPQHLAQARLRAIEEGLPVLRSTPTGISAVIDADGRLLQSMGWRRTGVIDAQLPGPKPPTPFARFGNALPLLFALLLAAAAIAVRRKHS
ncbi:MAG: lnt [Alphaproteobacteria bacterium]|nr:lnt [Alphaproteobacteria bacterium]